MKKTKTYIFHRGETFYPIDLYDDADAIKNAQWNPGTTLVTDTKGKIIWQSGNVVITKKD